MTEYQANEAQKRKQAINNYYALRSSDPGLSFNACAKRLKMSAKKLRALIKQFQLSGGDDAALAPKVSTGRSSIAERIKRQIGADQFELIRAKVIGAHLDTDSNTASWRLVAQSEACPEEVAEIILDPTKRSKHALPPSIRNATKITEAMRNAHRGSRALGLRGIWTPRKIDILPGDIFTSDDTTPIWACWVPWVKCKEYPFGVKVLQGQLLPVMDVASQCIIAFVLIAREKSSYRAADIWNLFGHTFDNVGLPRLGWQLERGSWEANLICGESAEYTEGEISHARRVGGLESLPNNLTDWHRDKFKGPVPTHLKTWTSFLPKSKSIESAFNRTQTFEGTLWGSLGRDQMRNPIEKTKKIFEACKRGAADPRLHFLSQIEILQKLKDIVGYVNSERMEGEVFSGVPQHLFDQAIQERPLLSMPPEERYLYRRDWRKVKIHRGWARVRMTHEIERVRYSLFYSNPSVFADHDGEEITVYFDRENFERPAVCHLARTGKFLCEAQYEHRRGAFLDDDQSGHDLRRKYKDAVMSAYATIRPHIPSLQVPEQVQARRIEAEAERRANASTPLTHAPSKHGTRAKLPGELYADGETPESRHRAEAPAKYVGNLGMQILFGDDAPNRTETENKTPPSAAAKEGI